MLSRRGLLPALALPALALGGRSARAAGASVRLGQATTALSFLPLWAARARGDFARAGVDLEWAAIPGGDPAALAALDAGDLDLAATGGETALQAISKGQPFSLVYTLMARNTLELVVGPGVTAQPGDPLPARIAALRGLTVGVSAVGGTQDRAVRWLAARGGLARADVQVALVGGPPALQAALENRRVDAFMLSPPEGQIAAAGGYGRTLISLASDFPALPPAPFLALVAKRPFARGERLRAAMRAIQDASRALKAEPAATADAIGKAYFARIPPEIVRAAVARLAPYATDGAVTGEGVAALARFGVESGMAMGPIPDDAWTDALVDPHP